MRFRLFIAILSSLAIALLWGCSPSIGSRTVLEVGDEKISLNEYEELYERNVGSRDAAKKTSPEEREKFLELLTNYKLKLRDAYARNLLNEQDVREELNDYRTSVAITFMIDREVTEPAVRTMYERRKEELRASHILIRVDQNASPADTLKAWTKALDIVRQLGEGKDFAALAEELSEDQSAKRNRGDLYYFTTGHMVPSFEDVAYTLRVGEYTRHPVRTQFGYHIIKLTDRKPAIFSISASHIMTENKQTGDTLAVDSALLKIRAIQDSLKRGHDFAALAQQYSEDPGSAKRGGSLGHFARRRFIQDFEEVAFKLKPGDVSDIVKTVFGYHIIKCDDVKPLPPFDEMRSELQRTFQAYRYNEDHRKYMNRWREHLGYTRNEPTLQGFYTLLDTTKPPIDSLWAANVPKEVRKKTGLTVGRRSFTVDTLIAILARRTEYQNTPITSVNFSSQIDKIGDYFLLELASAGLEDRHSQFKKLMGEFQDGVVLYKAEQMEVWNKIVLNEEKLRALHAERQNQYTLPDRVEFIEVSTDSQRLATRFINDVKKKRNIDTLVARSKGKLQKTLRGLVPADSDTLAKVAWAKKKGALIGPIRHKGRYVVVQVIKKDPARNKTFEEASAELSTALQDSEAKRLEREWLERLRARYPVVQHKDLLNNVFVGERPSS